MYCPSVVSLPSELSLCSPPWSPPSRSHSLPAVYLRSPLDPQPRDLRYSRRNAPDCVIQIEDDDEEEEEEGCLAERVQEEEDCSVDEDLEDARVAEWLYGIEKRLQNKVFVISLQLIMATKPTNGIADDSATEEFWQFLKPNLDEIFSEQKTDPGKLSGLEIQVRTHCHESVNWSQKLFENVQHYFNNYLTTLLKVADGLPNEELLRYISKQWQRYQQSHKAINFVFEILNMKLERHYGKNLGKKYNYTDEMFNVTWKEQFHEPLLFRVTSVMHQLPEADRQGEIVELCDVSAVINSWTELQANFENMKDTGDNSKNFVYCTDETYKNLEGCMDSYTDTYIENMTAFSKKMSMESFERCSFVEYMQEALKIINGEDKRIKYCLLESEQCSASTTCNQIWVSEHSETFLKEFQNFLSINNHEHLGVLHKLVFRLELVYKDFQEILKKQITTEFSNALLNGGKDASTDPKIYAKLTLDVYAKYQNIVKNSFGNDCGCKTALRFGCRDFINNDNGTITPDKSSEFLARYLDTVLRTSKDQDDGELEAIVNRIMLVFESIADKDVFYTFYGKFLAKRLVHNASVNLDMESYVITKLKENCGYGATKKFQNMFQDIVVSKDLNKAYRTNSEADKATKKSDHSVQVLSTGSWPFEKSEPLSIFPEIASFISSFTDFYVGRHNGRKLNWMYHLSSGELVSTCFKKRYKIQASTFQAAILLRFNDAVRYSIQQLHEDTGIRLDYLKPVIKLLLKSKLLVHEEDGELNRESHVALFLGYKNKTCRVNINMPLKIEKKVEQNTTYYDIQRARTFLIQAAIVRIMKMRQKCCHEELVVEIINELNSLFNPPISKIKICIDGLIEKEYIDRDPNIMNQYRYVA